MTPHLDADTIVIGGGIIGVAISAALSEQTVLVLDAGTPRSGTSMANAGHVVVSHASPFAAPGMVRTGIASLIARDGSFALSPRLPLTALSWLARFASNCTSRNVAALTPGMLELLRTSAEQVQSLNVPRTASALWEVFSSPHSPDHAQREMDHMHALGIGARLVDRTTALHEDPILTERTQVVVELQEDFGIDPEVLWRTLRAVNPQSTYLDNTVVESLVPHADHVNVGVGGRTFTARSVVIAAGVWTPQLTRLMGVRLPILAAKGYSLTLAHPELNARHPMILADHKSAIDPMGDSLRISARFELTRPSDRAIDLARIRHLYQRAQDILRLPPLPHSLEELSPWTGVRPASADGAPFIGPLRQTPNVLVASGHGMIGTAMAMGTADLIARYVRGETIAPTLTALSPNR